MTWSTLNDEDISSTLFLSDTEVHTFYNEPLNTDVTVD